jgi:hypothetical protein
MSFTPKNLSQRDPRWKDENIGFDATFTIATDGCALTCLTMLANGVGLDETPSSMNRKLKELGSGIGFLGALIVWPGVTRAFPKITFRRVIVCRGRPAPLDEINKTLDSGQPLLVEIEPSPAPDLSYHWVVLYARQGDDYLMLDPWPQPPDTAPTCLLARYGYGRAPGEFITAVAWFEAAEKPLPVTAAAHTPAPRAVEGAIPAPTPVNPASTPKSPEPSTPDLGSATQPILPPVPVTPASTLESVESLTPAPESAAQPIHPATPVTPVSTPGSEVPLTPPPVPAAVPITQAPASPSGTPPIPAALTVLVSQNIGSVGLRLRDQPASNSNTLAILSAGAELTILEPADQALLKIGQVNQWLNVRDERGNLGYVAAWYVKPNPALALVSPSKPLTVLVSSQASAGLRLRDRPSDNGNILEVLMPGTSLTVLEPAATALARIGVVNQWLNVRLPGGMTGYVAAWFVTR